jgi:predicted nucleic acid-binding protein
VLLDSSAVLPVVDSRDPRHTEASRTVVDLARLRCRLIQTFPLRAETHALLLARLGPDAARQWLADPSAPITPIDPGDQARAERIVLRHTDKDYSLCDAISFAVMERLHARVAFTFDRHFRQYGFEVVP